MKSALTNVSPFPAGSRQEQGKLLFRNGSVLLPPVPVAEILYRLALGGSVHVRSKSNPNRRYSVNGCCTCEDYDRYSRYARWMCKHRWALYLALCDREEDEDLEAELSGIGGGTGQPAPWQQPDPDPVCISSHGEDDNFAGKPFCGSVIDQDFSGF